MLRKNELVSEVTKVLRKYIGSDEKGTTEDIAKLIVTRILELQQGPKSDPLNRVSREHPKPSKDLPDPLYRDWREFY